MRVTGGGHLMSTEKPDLRELRQLPQPDATPDILRTAAAGATGGSPPPQLFSFKGLFLNVLRVQSCICFCASWEHKYADAASPSNAAYPVDDYSPLGYSPTELWFQGWRHR